jgi:hypothetical protein
MVTGLAFVSCVLAISSQAPAFGPGSQPKPKGFSVAEVPATPTFQLADPALDAFGFDRFAAAATERPSPDSGFIRGRFAIRATHWTDSLSWPSSAPLASLEDPLGPPPSPAAAPPENASDDEEPSPETLVDEPRVERDRRENLARWYDAFAIAAASHSAPAGRPDLIPAELLPSLGTPRKPCRKRPIQISRYGGESDALLLIGCDGAIAPDALDRISVLLRPPGIALPALPLPDEANESAIPAGEWVEGVKLAHPRLVWLIQQVADAFPWRQIYVMSGYRRGSHEGMHGQARAVDLFVLGVPNERVYKVCREIVDAGCGYYPNNRFVHIDARKPGTGHAYWIDTSRPGEPSEYVDSWPGVEEKGARAWVSER